MITKVEFTKETSRGSLFLLQYNVKIFMLSFLASADMAEITEKSLLTRKQESLIYLEPLRGFEPPTRALRMRLYTFSAMLERRRKPYFTEFFYFFVVLDWSLLGIILEVSSPNYPQRTIATNPDFSLDLGSKTDYRSLRLIMPNGILLVN